MSGVGVDEDIWLAAAPRDKKESPVGSKVARPNVHYVGGGADAKRGRAERSRATQSSQAAVLKEIVELADRCWCGAEEPILGEARGGKYDHSRRDRPTGGDTVLLGNVAAGILEATDISVLFVAT
jgi:hypothetical protein